VFLRILFADDHEIFRAGLRQVLAADAEIQILAELADGESALREIRALKPEIAVLVWIHCRRRSGVYCG